MADYWKSQARKYCDFCKCWIADKVPTIQYHENGKRHKENVAKRISEMAKKSAKQHKENVKLAGEMKKMEDEAMKAYMKDVKARADFTSSKLKEKLIESKVLEETEEERYAQEKKTLEPVPEKPKTPWYEGKSPEGYSYYWNKLTSESRWDEPEEGFISLGKQERDAQTQAKLAEAEKRASEQAAEQAAKDKAEELRAFKQREAMKKFRMMEEEKERARKKEEEASECVIGPTPTFVAGPQVKVDPYGSWTLVKRVEPKKIDLQLPIQPPPVVPVVTFNEPRFVIKEKQITSLGDNHEEGEKITFKKRKLSNQKAHMRQRIDHDAEYDENED